MKRIGEAVLSAYKQVVAMNLTPYRLMMSPSAHRELIVEMAEPPGSRLYVLAGMDVVLDPSCGVEIYVDGRGTAQ